MSGGEDTTMYALGIRSPSHKIFLLEISFAEPDEEPSIREAAQIPGLFLDDDFEGVLACEGAERFVLVAVLVGSNGRCIYRVSLGEDGSSDGV